MKKKIFPISVVTLVIIICSVVFVPRNIIHNAESVQIHRIVYKGTDITETVNIDYFIDVLDEYKCQRSLNTYFPYQLDDIVLEINGVCDNKPMHILLGNFNILYESAEKGASRILSAEKLLLELECFIK